jgi:large subunit ribosomal protein L17
MRHRKRVVKLGRMSSHRNAMFSNMAASVILNKKIHTTISKAKAVKPFVEKLITWAKEGSIHARRLAFSVLKSRDIVKVLFSEVAPNFIDRNGGYTRILRAGVRAGDGATMAILELVGQEKEETKEEKKEKKKEKKVVKKEEEPKERKKTKEKPNKEKKQ